MKRLVIHRSVNSWHCGRAWKKKRLLACKRLPSFKDTPLARKTPVRAPVRSLLCFDTRQIVSRMEEFREANLRSLLKQLRTDIAMAVDDSFPLVHGLADKNIITDQLQKVGEPAPGGVQGLWTEKKGWRRAVFTGDTGEREQRRDPQGDVLTPVLGLTPEKIRHPGLLEQFVQRLQPGQLPQAAEADHTPALRCVRTGPTHAPIRIYLLAQIFWTSFKMVWFCRFSRWKGILW